MSSWAPPGHGRGRAGLEGSGPGDYQSPSPPPRSSRSSRSHSRDNRALNPRAALSAARSRRRRSRSRSRSRERYRRRSPSPPLGPRGGFRPAGFEPPGGAFRGYPSGLEGARVRDDQAMRRHALPRPHFRPSFSAPDDDDPLPLLMGGTSAWDAGRSSGLWPGSSQPLVNDPFSLPPSPTFRGGARARVRLDISDLDARDPDLSEPFPPSHAHSVTRGLGVIREYISDTAGILDYQPNQRDGPFFAVYFHISVTFVPNTINGDVYGPPVRYIDIVSRAEACLDRLLPVGSEVFFNAVEVNSPFFEFLAMTVWPNSTENPSRMEPITNQSDFLSQFHERTTPDTIVPLTINGLDRLEMRDARAKVWEIKDEYFGVIEVLIGSEQDRFFCMFHRSDVYLADGQKAVLSDVYRDKPLNDIVKVNQEVNLTARSIVLTKGSFLKAAVLELQAVVVSLNPFLIPRSAPRPTKFKGGDGLLGSRGEYSHGYLNTRLREELNLKLNEFLRKSRTAFPQLDPKFISDLEPEPLKFPLFPTEHPLHGHNVRAHPILPSLGLVKEVLSEGSGLIELSPSGNKSGLCLFTVGQMIPKVQSSLYDIIGPGVCVKVISTLVDDQKMIPNLATLVCSDRFEPSPDQINAAQQPDEFLLQKYHDVNEMLSVQVPDSTTTMSKSGKSDNFPDYYDAKEGKLFRILDENFGLVKIHYNLVLFDVCDLWIDPITTASRDGKKLFQVIQEGQRVRFHGTLVDASAKIQYLASSVWSADNRLFTPENQPQSVSKDKIHSDKIKIYRTVVASVGENLPEFYATDNPLLGETSGSNRCLEDELGEVVLLILDNTKFPGRITGGVLRLSKYKSHVFFLSRSCSVSTCLKIGDKLSCTVMPLEKSDVPSIHGLAIRVTSVDDNSRMPTRDEVDRMSERTSAYLERVLSPIQKETLQAKILKPTIPLMGLDSNALVGMREPLPEMHLQARFVSLINKDVALLQAKSNPSQYIYYELDGLHLALPRSQDLCGYLEDHGTELDLEAHVCEVEAPGPVKLIAHSNGVSVKGPLPSDKLNAIQKLDFSSAFMVPIYSDITKWERFANLQGELKEACEANGLLYDLELSTGIFKFALNENFGLIHGFHNGMPQRYCLFDTYDLKVSAEHSAADRSLSINQVLTSGDEVQFNACVIDQKSCVPYLGTSVWKAGQILPTPEPLDKSAIQPDKIAIYKQVVESCRDFIESRANDDIVTPSGAIASSSKALVSNQDPHHQLEQPQGSKGYYALKDESTTGVIYKELCSRFAILSVGPNDERALLATNRVWIGTTFNPKESKWSIIRRSSSKLYVCAREVEGFKDFRYQVVYCHLGFGRLPRSDAFDFNSKIKAWIRSRSHRPNLNRELKDYSGKYERS
ncbi:hypothetical protein TCAL_06944 [Tigriopus californicus]|uniref:Uncharacterized protein n=1 Tax=Tigriopus californicus TaxID=6832 RepID=A0A553NVH4_TIGCA|nr:uncharacterized protein LOC131888875 [Tigriopus californicus]TRY69416.1 hypothetical protein TCAL_06944 [Tigriopus californicus]